MKAVFGILSLLIVLAVLAFTAKRQLQATVIAPLPAGAVVTGASGPAMTVPDQARALQDRVRVDTARALQQGSDRAASADQ